MTNLKKSLPTFNAAIFALFALAMMAYTSSMEFPFIYKFIGWTFIFFLVWWLFESVKLRMSPLEPLVKEYWKRRKHLCYLDMARNHGMAEMMTQEDLDIVRLPDKEYEIAKLRIMADDVQLLHLYKSRNGVQIRQQMIEKKMVKVNQGDDYIEYELKSTYAPTPLLDGESSGFLPSGEVLIMPNDEIGV